MARRQTIPDEVRGEFLPHPQPVTQLAVRANITKHRGRCIYGNFGMLVNGFPFAAKLRIEDYIFRYPPRLRLPPLQNRPDHFVFEQDWLFVTHVPAPQSFPNWR